MTFKPIIAVTTPPNEKSAVNIASGCSSERYLDRALVFTVQLREGRSINNSCAKNNGLSVNRTDIDSVDELRGCVGWDKPDSVP